MRNLVIFGLFIIGGGSVFFAVIQHSDRVRDWWVWLVFAAACLGPGAWIALYG
jgi:hypothetical protein